MLFRGAAPALATPFRAGTVDWDAFKRMLDFQLENGSDALVVCGTTGEPSTLTTDEQQELVRVAVDQVAGEVPVIAGCGGNNTARVAKCAGEMEQIGADGLLVVTPYYNKTTQAGLVAHYNVVADATSLPIIVYNVPSRTGMNVEPKTMAEMAKNPQLRTVKEASGNLSQIIEYFRVCGDRVSILSGNDDHVYPLLAMGGDGVISVASNIVPRQMHDMTSAYFDGDAERSFQIQLSLLPLISSLFTEVNPIPVKAALALMGMAENELRLPLVPLSEKNEERLEQAMADLGLI